MSGIRKADIPDMKHIVALARELHERSVYSGIKGDEQKFKQTVAGLMGHRRGHAYVVVDNDDKPVGFMLGVVEELWFSRSRYASDIATYIQPGYRRYALRLYKNFIEWASSKPKVVEISLAQSSGIGDPERWNRLMDHLGLKPMGSIYTMRVNQCPA